MIDQGIDMYGLLAKEAHKRGINLYSRLEMNHEYGPDTDDVNHPNYWMWRGFMVHHGSWGCSYPMSSVFVLCSERILSFSISISR